MYVYRYAKPTKCNAGLSIQVARSMMVVTGQEDGKYLQSDMGRLNRNHTCQMIMDAPDLYCLYSSEQLFADNFGSSSHNRMCILQGNQGWPEQAETNGLTG